MKLLLCITLLLGGCYTSSVSNYKKPNNSTSREDLQEKFEEIDLNNDGVIDKSEAKKHEENQPAKPDLSTPTSSFLLIMGFMAFACILPIAFTFIANRFRDFRKKKRIQ